MEAALPPPTSTSRLDLCSFCFMILVAGAIIDVGIFLADADSGGIGNRIATIAPL
jgi:hypothetical protein